MCLLHVSITLSFSWVIHIYIVCLFIDVYAYMLLDWNQRNGFVANVHYLCFCVMHCNVFFMPFGTWKFTNLKQDNKRNDLCKNVKYVCTQINKPKQADCLWSSDPCVIGSTLKWQFICLTQPSNIIT